MKYPGTVLARKSGCIPCFLVYNDAIEIRRHIPLLVFLFPYSKDNLSFLFNTRRGVKRLGLRAAAGLCTTSQYLLEEGVSVWQEPCGQMLPLFQMGATPIPKHTAWLRECRLDFSHGLPAWSGAIVQCRKYPLVLGSILFSTIQAAWIASSMNCPQGKSNTRRASKQAFEIHSRDNNLESQNNLDSPERPGPFQGKKDVSINQSLEYLEHRVYTINSGAGRGVLRLIAPFLL